MCAVIVCIFMVCWAPYHIYFILVYHNPSLTKNPYISDIYLAFYWLTMANSCVNPIIYYWMNARFRAYFNQVLCCVPTCVRHSTSRVWEQVRHNLVLHRKHRCSVRINNNPTITRDSSTNTEGEPFMPLDMSYSNRRELLF